MNTIPEETQEISLDEMMRRIKHSVTGHYDLVVGVERGGILPGYLVSRYLDIPFNTIALRFRDDNHQKMFNEPQLAGIVNIESQDKHILLVDDVANSGATLSKAAELLPGAVITTMVISGNGDISLFGPHDRCIHWPWQP
jgi:hypoxanthine phosphoribosyltransferase